MAIIRCKDEKTPRTIYRCDCCGFQGTWNSKDWRNAGTIEEILDGDGDHLCSEACLKKHRPDCVDDVGPLIDGTKEKKKVGRPRKGM